MGIGIPRDTNPKKFNLLVASFGLSSGDCFTRLSVLLVKV